MSTHGLHLDRPATEPEDDDHRPRPSLRQLRVLLLASNGPGLGQSWIARAGRALGARGHRVDLRVVRSGRAVPRPDDPGMEFGELPAARRLDPRPALRLGRLLGSWKPQAILVGDPGAMRWLDRARWGRPLPPILLRREAEGTSGPEAQDSVEIRVEGVRTRLPVAAGSMLVAGDIPPDRTAVLRELRLPRRDALVVMTGPFVSGAGQDVALRALQALCERALQTNGGGSKRRVPKLVLVGTGPEEERLHVLSHELGLQDHVLWVGHRSNPIPHIQAGDVLLVPVSTRGTTKVVHDALGAGTPVVASGPAGSAAGIEHGRNGLLASDGEAGALAAALEQVLADGDLAAALARAGHELAARIASPDRLGLELECLVAASTLAKVSGAGKARPVTRRAVFLDRDGTLVRNVPYNTDPEAVALEPDAAWALRCFAAAGLGRVVVSNQSAVARGIAGEADVRAVNDRILDLLRAAGADLDGVYFCPHHPDHGPACECRKPAPGLLLQAARDLRLDRARSITIGDEPRDLEAGRRAGTATAAYSGSWLETCARALAALLERT